jgi:hypothetical protein
LRTTIHDPLSYYGDNFGGSVAISSSTLAVGSSTAGNQEGALYIYSRTGTHWTRRATFNDPASNFGDYYGYAVAVSGTTVIATAANAGISYVYTSRDGRHWTQSAVMANPGDPADGYGASAALSGNTAIIGAPGNGTSFSQGASYVFVHSRARWRVQARLVSPNGYTNDEFGNAVSISGNRAVIGAPINGRGNCGTAYEFLRDEASWHRYTIRNPNCATGNQFGWSTTVSGTTGVIGAPAENNAYIKPLH